jgi:hypothetical protein
MSETVSRVNVPVLEISREMAKNLCEMLKGKPLRDDEVERVTLYIYRCSTMGQLGWAIVDGDVASADATTMREACRQVAERYIAASGNDGNPNDWNAGWEAAAKAIEHEIHEGDPLRNAKLQPPSIPTEKDTR